MFKIHRSGNRGHSIRSWFYFSFYTFLYDLSSFPKNNSCVSFTLPPKASACIAGDQVRSLGREDSLEKEMATHSGTFAWKIHGRRSLACCSPWGHRESDRTERLHFPFQKKQRQKIGNKTRWNSTLKTEESLILGRRVGIILLVLNVRLQRRFKEV